MPAKDSELRAARVRRRSSRRRLSSQLPQPSFEPPLQAPTLYMDSHDPSSPYPTTSSSDVPLWLGGSSPPATLGPLPGPLDRPIPRPLALDDSAPSDDLESASESETEAGFLATAGEARITLFHHVVLVLARFAVENFPFLVPRVLLSEETITPFVRWRTGGGAGGLIREYGPESSSDGSSSAGSATGKSFRAYWIGGDSHLSSMARRNDFYGRQATTVLWIHGGGFVLGSVAFYAESLLRILAKICAIEHDAAVISGAPPPSPEARCVAVEYSLGPNARFPDALLECLRTYAHLVEVEMIDPESIVFAGDSAGGNLAMAMILALSGQGNDPSVWQERDWSALPLPGKAVLLSPWVDLRPNEALAFNSLRPSATARTPSPASGPSPNLSDDTQMEQSDDDESSRSTVTAGSADPGTDYLAPEGLLHFAQVYSGVLDVPRRVSGPAGWIAGVLRTFDTAPTIEALDALLPEASKGVSALGRSLSSAVLNVLDIPLFERALPPQQSTTNAAVIKPSEAYFGMTPLLGPSERASVSVPTSSHLYEADLAFGSSKARKAGEGMNSREWAAEVQAEEPLMSPVAGDWSQIRLSRGMVAVYGSHEVLSPDIERWCKAAGARSIVQHGPSGVHVWPLVNMYIAATPQERERGLDVVARAMAQVHRHYPRVMGLGFYPPPDASPSDVSSPGSMPSDAWGLESPNAPHEGPYMTYPEDYPLPLFGDTPSEVTPSESPTGSVSDEDDGEENSNKLSGTPLHTYPPRRMGSSSAASGAWWTSVAVAPSSRGGIGSPLDTISEYGAAVPAPPARDGFPEMHIDPNVRLDGLSDITEETEMGSVSSPPNLVTRATGSIAGPPTAAATATATASTAASPEFEPALPVQGLGTAGDMLRAYLEVGPTPNAGTPSVAPMRPSRNRASGTGGDVWW